MEIREAAEGDAEDLQELYLRHLTAHPPEEPQPAEAWRAIIRRFAADPDYHLLVGMANGRAVSSVTLVVVRNLTHGMRPYGLVENVVTHADFRNRGHAGALMAHACGIAAGENCYKVMLMTGSKKESTLNFYRQCGFNDTDKTAFIRWFS